MFGGIIEIVAGTAMIVYPEPLSTGAGITLVADGVRRITDEIG
jgi:hypothetical protein